MTDYQGSLKAKILLKLIILSFPIVGKFYTGRRKNLVEECVTIFLSQTVICRKFEIFEYFFSKLKIHDAENNIKQMVIHIYEPSKWALGLHLNAF